MVNVGYPALKGWAMLCRPALRDSGFLAVALSVGLVAAHLCFGWLLGLRRSYPTMGYIPESWDFALTGRG
jgi:hypothetical protein